MDSTMADLLATATDPAPAINKWKGQTQGAVIGYLPIYVPEEIVHAAGALPVGLWGGNTQIDQATAHLQVFACSIVRAVLEYALKGTYDMVDGFVFPSTCDHIQNTADVWAKILPSKPKFDLVYPANRKSKGAKEYLLRLYAEFRVWVEEISGANIDVSRLQASIEVYNNHRKLMNRLSRLRAERPVSLTAREMAGIVKASQFMPKEEFDQQLELLLPWLERRIVREPPNTRLVLAGIMAEPEEILDIVEELGGAVVGDDLALGDRLYRIAVNERIAPFEALAERHLEIGPCSTLFDPNKERGACLKEIVQKTNADGVVFINMQFCELEEFDFPILKWELEQARIPLLFLETGQQTSSFSQIRTRLQAFIEMVS